MAYLDLQHATTCGSELRAQPAAPVHDPLPARDFSSLEWSVVALARRDSLTSLRAPGPLAKSLGGLFGLGRRSKLADPRLEALRRFAVHAWYRGYALPVSEIKAFLRAGFTIEQAEAALGSIAGERSNRRKTTVR